ncbi:MAG TPA: hypothetical protein VI585_11900 [Candidatus Binatia bacterium]
MKKGFYALVLLLLLCSWVEAQVLPFLSVKQFVIIEFQGFGINASNWMRSSPGEGGCISYTANSPGPQSLTLSAPDGTTQQHFVNAGQVVFVCGDVAHIPALTIP